MRSRCRERIGRLRDAELGSEELRHEAIAELRRAIGFDRWCWAVGDPDSLLATGAVYRIDFEATVPRLLVLEQAGDVNGKHVLARSRYPSAALDAATGGDLALSTRWDECLRPYGVGDLLSSACRDGHGCWGWLDLIRDTDDPPFAGADIQLVDEVAADLGTALRRAAVRPSQWTGEEPPGPGLVILDEQLRPASWTPSARAWVKGMQYDAERDGILPTIFYGIAGRVLANGRTRASRLPASMRFQTEAGRWTIADGAALEGAQAGCIAITIRAATPAEVVELHCQAHGLTPRERQLVQLILSGLSTRQLADELSISPYTVKDHLKAVFDKVGVRSRGELVADILGQAPVAEPVAQGA